MKRRGRPQLDDADQTSKITIRLPTRQLDTYCKQANRDDVSLAEVIRRQLPPPNNRGGK